ncbi:MAG TPA: PKD domain-containing protein [Pelobium sp.]|nr:PKD domain-containing protein [Pelobium sp.]
MPKLLIYIAILCLSFCGIVSQAQVIIPADTVAVKINYTFKGDSVKFTSELRPLRPIAGAPEPFYTYFWEFGDGEFSFQKEPIHTYSDTGIYHPRLYATNNYDDGKAPPRRPGTINVKKIANPTKIANATNFFKVDQNLALKTNNMPKPNEEMVLILGYKKDLMLGSLQGKGAIILFYNDKEFAKDNFKIDTVRLHHGEKKTVSTNYLQLASKYIHSQKYYAQNGPSNKLNSFDLKSKAELIKERVAKYRNMDAWTYDNLNKQEERFMFFSIKTTPEMLADTNAVVTLSAMMIPDDPLADVSVCDLELQIVASHDPNKMMLRNRSMNYRFVGKNRRLNYKVRFQNTGKGPAKMVNVGVKIPENLDKSSIKILETNPKVALRDSTYLTGSVLDTLINKDTVNFIFRNIYLKGTQQDGVNDADSTKGFVEYSIKFVKKPQKKPFDSGASIIFDKNEPIYTNRSKGKFKPGISPGIITGYGMLGGKKTLNDYGNKSFSLGFSISPFSPYRKYLQAEIYLAYYNYSNQFKGIAENFKAKDTTVNNRDGYLITGRKYYAQSSHLNIDIVPVQLRYNINSFVGVGAGGIVSLTIRQNTKNYQQSLIAQRQANGTSPNVFTDQILLSAIKNNFSELKTAAFADVQVGLVRKGPALGFRYIHSFAVKDERFFTYLSWKF